MEESQNHLDSFHKPADYKTHPSSAKKYFILVAFILFAILLAGALLVFNAKKTSSQKIVSEIPDQHTTTQVTPSTTATEPTPIPSELEIYALENTSLKKETTIRDLASAGFGHLEPILDKQGSIYIPDKETIYRYDTAANTTTTYYKNTDPMKYISGLKMDENAAYISEAPYNYVAGGKFTINEIKKDSKLIINDIGPFNVGYFGNITYLFPGTNSEVVGSFGGDGCGGWGTIYSYNKGSVETIENTGAGCSDGPRYIGFDKKTNAIILASVLPIPTGSDSIEKPYDSLYSEDVKTKEKTTLYDLQSLPGDAVFALNEDSTKIVVIEKTEAKIINLTTKTLEKTLILPIATFSWRYNNNNLYGVDSQKPSLYVVDTNTGEAKEIPYSLPKGNEGLAFLGVYNGVRFFYSYINHY